MEARRRRDSAKSSAASVLPSTQDEEFHLRLIDQYGKHECLWNTSLKDYENKELKEKAWLAIAKDLGSHLSPALLKSRMRNLRHHLNVYKLQEIEYKMCPNNAKQPEKPYYSDRFAFLERQQPSQPFQPPPENPSKSHETLSKLEDAKKRPNRMDTRRQYTGSSSSSIASMVKQRLAEHPKLPVSALRQRLQLSISCPSSEGGDGSSGRSHAPRLLAGHLPSILKAHPGDSVSQTKLVSYAKPASLQLSPQEEEVQSEDEELYHKHWNIRQQMSSQRQRTAALLNSLEKRCPKTPAMPLTLRSKLTPDNDGANII